MKSNVSNSKNERMVLEMKSNVSKSKDERMVLVMKRNVSKSKHKCIDPMNENKRIHEQR